MASKGTALQTQNGQSQAIQRTNSAEGTRAYNTYIPRVDIYETGDNIVLLADMPGVDENSLDIVLEKNILTINGHVASPAPENYGLAYAEYEVGDYQRSFTLPNEIDRDKVEATVNNGILRLFLPKSEAAKAKKITIKAG